MLPLCRIHIAKALRTIIWPALLDNHCTWPRDVYHFVLLLSEIWVETPWRKFKDFAAA